MKISCKYDVKFVSSENERQKNKIVGDTRVIGHHRICMHSVSARKSYSINFFSRRENRALKFWDFDELLFVYRLKFVFAVMLKFTPCW